MSATPSTSDLDYNFAVALSVGEAVAILHRSQAAARGASIGTPARDGLLHDPALAIATLQQAASDPAVNLRTRATARTALETHFGVSLDQHPELLNPSVARAHLRVVDNGGSR